MSLNVIDLNFKPTKNLGDGVDVSARGLSFEHTNINRFTNSIIVHGSELGVGAIHTDIAGFTGDYYRIAKIERAYRGEEINDCAASYTCLWANSLKVRSSGDRESSLEIGEIDSFYHLTLTNYVYSTLLSDTCELSVLVDNIVVGKEEEVGCCVNMSVLVSQIVEEIWSIFGQKPKMVLLFVLRYEELAYAENIALHIRDAFTVLNRYWEDDHGVTPMIFGRNNDLSLVTDKFCF